MSSWYKSDASLDFYIEWAIRTFEEERNEYWKENPNNVFVDLADALAGLVATASEDLVQPDNPADFHSLDWDTARMFLGMDGPLPEQILERLQIDIAWSLNDTAAMARRCTEIAQHVVRQRPPEPVLRYLRRLSRCYVAGFMPECVMISRAVLENALKNAFHRKGVPLPENAAGRSEMRVRLDAAVRFGWLSQQASHDAWTVWTRGNKAAHEDPTVTPDALDTVVLTLGLLSELSVA